MTSGKVDALVPGSFLTVQFGVSGSKKPVLVKNVRLERSNASNNYIAINNGNTLIEVNLNENCLASLPDGTQDELTIDSAGNVTLTKRVGKVVLDGTENNWGRANLVNTTTTYSTQVAAREEGISSHFTFKIIDSTSSAAYDGNFDTLNGTLRFMNTNCADTDAWKTWLGSNNVTVYYKLENEQTIALDPITMPTIHDGDTISVSAAVTPTITAE